MTRPLFNTFCIGLYFAANMIELKDRRGFVTVLINLRTYYDGVTAEFIWMHYL